MEKLEEFNPDTQSVEDWLEGFEARATCSGITNLNRKFAWCKSVIGSTGRKILWNLADGATWEEAKGELKRFLGEEDSRAEAWKKLQHYKADGKSLGEVASDVIYLAHNASGEADVVNRLALEAFIGALPWKYAAEIRKKRIETVEAALKEVKVLKNTEEEGQRRNHAVLTNREEAPTRTNKTERKNWKKIICWGCGKEEHIWQDCPEVLEWKKYQQERKREIRNPPSLL